MFKLRVGVEPVTSLYLKNHCDHYIGRLLYLKWARKESRLTLKILLENYVFIWNK